jgi:hypothetical protein
MPVTPAGQTLPFMAGVTFADKAKQEILDLRAENEFLRKEVDLYHQFKMNVVKERYGLDGH